MPPLPLNLDAITKARTTLADQVQAQRTASADYRRATSELDTLRRSGADAAAIARAEAQVASLARTASALANRRRQSLAQLVTLSDRLLQRRDPSALVEALAATHPIALL